ncbi:MAG: hypothetical protein GX879_06385 [Bacteroidales bacterium]|nr:hypothetical protein [Bacteroidales bacterium]
MRKSILYRNNPLNYVLIVLVAILAAGLRIYYSLYQESAFCNYSFAFGFLTIENVPILINAILVSALFLVLAVFINILNNKFTIVEDAFQFPAFIFICFSALIVSAENLVPTLLSLFLVLLALYRILPIFRKNNASLNSLDAGIFIGLASLFSYYSIVFIAIIISAMIYLKHVRFRELYALAMGLLAPYFFFFFVVYMFDAIPKFQEAFLKNISFSSSTTKYSFQNILYSSSIILISSIAFFHNIALSGFKKILIRRYQSVLIIFIAISIFIILSPFVTHSSIVFLLAPFSLILSQMLIETKYKFFIYFIWTIFLINLVFVAIYVFTKA